MNALGTLLAVGGFAVAATLFADEDVGAIGRLLATAGAGLLVAAAVHIAPMIVNATAWRLLFVPGTRPRLPAVVKATWIRESVNGLLPVGRIGGASSARFSPTLPTLI